MSKIMHMDTQYAGVTPEKDFSELVDFFYPVGCYFETSDTTFNPNVSWSGTWILETEGQVHVSAGSTYTINGAKTNVSDGGEKTHVLTPAETAMKDHSHTINHGHGFTQPTVNGGNHSHGLPMRSGSGSTYGISTAGGSSAPYSWSTAGEGGHTHSVSGGSVSDHSGSSGGQTAANGSAHNNMQPYIVVNRWHRTA